MRMTGKSPDCANGNMPGAVRPATSLRMCAPWSKAVRATSALRVSMEMGVLKLPAARRSRTGRRRRISSWAETGSWPGRVDSAPMSRMCAPSATSLWACSSAAAGSVYLPPSLKESGVRFRMPIRRGGGGVRGSGFRGEGTFSTVWKKVFHSVENFCGEGVSGGEFFHGVEIIFPWRGKSGLFFSMVWKS